MERYHIYKLGLAVLFYAVYCRRPMLVNGLEVDDVTGSTNNRTEQSDSNYYSTYYQGVEGLPGVDFPVYSFIPRTSFNCRNVESGYYADLETDCQVFHICNDGRKISFLCPNGTIFQQSDLICEWWFKVNCTDSPKLYSESAEHLRDDTARRKANRRVNNNDDNHGAIMRMEEEARVTISQQTNRNTEVHAKTNVPKKNGGDQRVAQQQPKQKSIPYGGRTTERGSRKFGSGQDQPNNFVSTNRKPVNAPKVQDKPRETKPQGSSGVVNRNQISKFEPTESDEAQITEETASFVKNSFNQIPQNAKTSTVDPYPNHRNTYSPLKNPNYYTKQQFDTSTISYSTKSFNNGQPFVGKNLAYTTSQTNNNQVTGGTVKGLFNTGTTPPGTSTVPYYQEQTTIVPATNSPNFGRNRGTTDYAVVYGTFNSGVTTPKPSSRNQNRVPTTVVQNIFNTGAPTTIRPTPYNQNRVPTTSSTIQYNRNSQKTAFTNTANNRLPSTPTTAIPVNRNQYPTTQNTFKTTKVSFGSGFGNAQLGNEYYVNNIKSTTVSPYSFNVGRNTSTVAPSTKQAFQGNFYQGKSAQVTSGFTKTVFGARTSPITTVTTESTTTTESDTSTVNYVVSSPQPFKPNSVSQRFNIGSTIKPPLTTTTTAASTTRTLSTGLFNLGTSTKSDASNNVNRVNFLANGQPEVDSPRLILGIIRSRDRAPAKPSSFTGFRDNDLKSSTAAPVTTTVKNFPVSGFYVTKSSNVKTTSRAFNANSIAPTQGLQPPVRPQPFAPPSSTATPLSVTTRKGLEPASSVPTYKVSSASPFGFTTQTVGPTQPTPFTVPKPSSVYENVDNMINALMAIASQKEDRSSETPRPGLIIPPSVGPQTLHTLAVYFANALDNIAADKNKTNYNTGSNSTEEQFKHLLTKSTVYRYDELFQQNGEDKTTTEVPSEDTNDLDTEHSSNPVQTTPRVRQLARVFTEALSAYLDDPATFRKVLEEVRPTEPPATDDFTGADEDEVLNFSDADIKPRPRPVFPTPPSALSVSPTWGYILALNNNTTDIKSNSLGRDENLQGADSQSFIPRFNNLPVEQKTSAPPTTTTQSSDVRLNLPVDHWTDSPDVAKLWHSTLSVNPLVVNENFDNNDVLGTDAPALTDTTETNYYYPVESTPSSIISYELRSLPKLNLNSTQVHGILLDFMNKTEDSDKLQRILSKLNTTQEEFLAKMKEIEENPVTRRLILLLVSECAEKNSGEPETRAIPLQNVIRNDRPLEILQTANSGAVFSTPSPSVLPPVKNSNFKEIVHPSLKGDDEDTRALQLLNSLYTIAAKWGK